MTKLACLKKRLKNKKGFTLVELLVVLAIMAILIAVAVPTMTGALNDAKAKASMSDARAAYIAFELKRADATSFANIKKSDIAAYIGKNAADFRCAVEVIDIADMTKNVVKFYYQDKNLSSGLTGGKCIEIDMASKAVVSETGFPGSSAGNVLIIVN